MTTSSQPDRGAAAVQLLGAMYPAPLTVVVAPASSVTTRATWLALPSAGDPRLLLTAGTARASAQVLRRQLTGRRPRTRVARAGLGLALRSGLPSRMRRLRVEVQGPPSAPSIEDPLREVLGVADLLLTLPIGPARANRKPVLQVTDAAGTVLAFAKVGHNRLTRELVRHEAASLGSLGDLRLRGVRAPRVLGHVAWRDLELLVLEPLRVPSRRLTGAAARRRLDDVVRAVSDLDDRPPTAWRDHPHRARLRGALAECGDSADVLQQQLERLCADAVLEVAAWHGDLNSGNIALVRTACATWDWERFADGVPAGFDLLHHELHEAITVRGRAPREAAEQLLVSAPELLRPFGVGRESAEVTAHAYLLTLAHRYLVDDQEGAGADLGRVREWLVPALQSHQLDGARA